MNFLKFVEWIWRRCNWSDSNKNSALYSQKQGHSIHAISHISSFNHGLSMVEQNKIIFFPPHIWNASKLKLSLESCSVQWRWDPFINKKMFGILNKDSWYLAGFVIYRLSFWLITTLTVSMETKKNYFCLQGTHAKMRNILPLWRIHTHTAFLVNFVLLSILPREKAKPVGGYQRL